MAISVKNHHKFHFIKAHSYFLCLFSDASQKEHHSQNLFGRKMEIVLPPAESISSIEMEQDFLSIELIWKVSNVSYCIVECISYIK